MRKAPSKLAMLLAGLVGFVASTSAQAAAREYTPADVLKIKPRQLGVDCSTPKTEDEGKCRLDVEKGSGKQAGYVLRDPQGKFLRRFFDTVGDGKIHVWSYYKDGVEVYREIDTDGNGKPDQYRWVNSGGSRWGIDHKEVGIIDEWKSISPEEIGQELLIALNTKDFNRVKTLMITDAEIKALKFSDTESKRIHDVRDKAADKFRETLNKTHNFTDRTRVLNIDVSVPECIPAEQTGGTDIVHYVNIGVACGTGDKDSTTTWIQTGEIIQVGSGWRIVDAPREGLPEFGTNNAQVSGSLPDEVQKIIDALVDFDKAHPVKENPTAQELIAYHTARVDIVEKIVLNAKCPVDEKIKRAQEMSDGLAAAAQSGDKASYERLAHFEKTVLDSKLGGDALASFVSYREIQTKYFQDMNSGKAGDAQKTWAEQLAKFVQAYPKALEAPEALKELGLVNEFLGQEIPAKNWYQQLVKDYDSHPLAEVARGCIRRLESEGKPFELTARKMQGGGQFDIADFKGKIVLVYYWASENPTQCAADFARLKLLMKDYRGKDVELVCVNLDNNASDGEAFVKENAAPGIHVCNTDAQPSGLQSKLALEYGIQVLPHMFLIKDGKVVNRSAQGAMVAEEIAKLLK
jgi:peroxiredoxin